MASYYLFRFDILGYEFASLFFFSHSLCEFFFLAYVRCGWVELHTLFRPPIWNLLHSCNNKATALTITTTTYFAHKKQPIKNRSITSNKRICCLILIQVIFFYKIFTLPRDLFYNFVFNTRAFIGSFLRRWLLFIQMKKMCLKQILVQKCTWNVTSLENQKKLHYRT